MSGSWPGDSPERKNCLDSPNGLHRVTVMQRLAFMDLPFLQGECQWCRHWCKALKRVGARWFTVEQFARFYSYEIPELP